MSRNTPKYMEDLNQFLNFDFANNNVREKIIIYPCQKHNFNNFNCTQLNNLNYIQYFPFIFLQEFIFLYLFIKFYYLHIF